MDLGGEMEFRKCARGNSTSVAAKDVGNGEFTAGREEKNRTTLPPALIFTPISHSISPKALHTRYIPSAHLQVFLYSCYLPKINH